MCDSNPELQITSDVKASALRFFLEPPCPFFPWCFCFLGVFLLCSSLVFLSVFCFFSGFRRVRKARKILGVFEVCLGIFEKSKEKKDRDCTKKNVKSHMTRF